MMTNREVMMKAGKIVTEHAAGAGAGAAAGAAAYIIT